MSLRVAVDIGGTFTDLIAFDEGSRDIRHAKTLTTPRDPVQGILDCLRKAALEASAIEGQPRRAREYCREKGARSLGSRSPNSSDGAGERRFPPRSRAPG